jgi:ATP-dependent Clp protease ATP-binding subunit ClpA
MYGRDLTEVAARGDPVVGRDAEIDRVVSILSRKSKNSAVLVGAPGVGKTAIAEGLAQRLADGRVPGPLAGARLVELSVPKLLAGCRYIGVLQERVTGVIGEAEAADGPGGRKVVLFVDEIHMLIGAGRYRGSETDVADMLKPALARGSLHCLALASPPTTSTSGCSPRTRPWSGGSRRCTSLSLARTVPLPSSAD